MANSAVKICNSALILVGADRISSLSDDRIEARILNAIYDDKRDQLIAEHPWNFAQKRVALAATTDTPAFDFDYEFQLPTDCLRVLSTDLGSQDDWAIEGRKLLCNSSSVKILYLRRVQEEGDFSPGFCEALSHKLAIYLAYNLTESSTLAQRLQQQYIIVLRNAKAQDAQEHSAQTIEADTWIFSRY